MSDQRLAIRRGQHPQGPQRSVEDRSPEAGGCGLLGARSLSSVRDPGAFLNRIVRNLVIDRSRRLSARSPHVAIGVDADVAVAPDQGQAIEVEQMRQRYRELVQRARCRLDVRRRL